jgi:hypothetical protein
MLVELAMSKRRSAAGAWLQQVELTHSVAGRLFCLQGVAGRKWMMMMG